MEQYLPYIVTFMGGLFAAIPLARYIVKATASTKDDEMMARVDEYLPKAVNLLETLLKKDIDGDGKIGK